MVSLIAYLHHVFVENTLAADGGTDDEGSSIDKADDWSDNDCGAKETDKPSSVAGDSDVETVFCCSATQTSTPGGCTLSFGIDWNWSRTNEPPFWTTPVPFLWTFDHTTFRIRCPYVQGYFASFLCFAVIEKKSNPPYYYDENHRHNHDYYCGYNSSWRQIYY